MYILIINPGSTSTKVGLSMGSEVVATETLYHDVEELQSYATVMEQKEMRQKGIEKFLAEQSLDLKDLAAVVGRGGLLDPVQSGTYIVNPNMLEDLMRAKHGQHASNLGAVLAWALAEPIGIPAYVVDPPAVDEFSPLARYSGWPEIRRVSFFHALNLRRVVLKAAQELRKTVAECHFVAVHLGGGISVAAVRSGRVVDVSNANHGGPFSPERAGALPAGDLLNLCFSGQYNEQSLRKQINGKSGLTGYLGTNNARMVEERVQRGDNQAHYALMAMAYQIAKEIGSMAATLPKLDGVIYTGGLAYSQMLLSAIKEYVGTLALSFDMPGENELLALAEGAYRVLTGEEEALQYPLQ